MFNDSNETFSGSITQQGHTVYKNITNKDIPKLSKGCAHKNACYVFTTNFWKTSKMLLDQEKELQKLFLNIFGHGIFVFLYPPKRALPGSFKGMAQKCAQPTSPQF